VENLARRSVLKAIGAAGICGTAKAAIAAPRAPFFQRVGLPIGLQIYTLGDDAGRDLDASFASVAKIGYREIEMPSLFGRKPADVAAAAARAGLSISSLHLPLLTTGNANVLSLASDPAKIAEALTALGASWATAPILLIPNNFRPQAGENFSSAIARSVAVAGEDIWKRSAAQLNEKAAALRPLGIGVAYHNHNIEFAPIGKTTGWDILWRETDPSLVSFEVDIGWVAAAGRDPVAFLQHSRGRVRLLHVKDIAAGSERNFKIEMKPAEVGAGILPWSRILPAAHAAGVRHFYVEQEPPFVIPRIEAARKSYDYLAKLRA
jgi:sugar phosphate isomerase/epimerase